MELIDSGLQPAADTAMLSMVYKLTDYQLHLDCEHSRFSMEGLILRYILIGAQYSSSLIKALVWGVLLLASLKNEINLRTYADCLAHLPPDIARRAETRRRIYFGKRITCIAMYTVVAMTRWAVIALLEAEKNLR